MSDVVQTLVALINGRTRLNPGPTEKTARQSGLVAEDQKDRSSRCDRD